MKFNTLLEAWARIPRRVVIHRMETADCFESRCFWAMILWSWCGPQSNDYVCVKDRRGFIQKTAAGEPIPAKPRDLLSLLGLAAAMKGNLSRVIQRLQEKGSLRIEGKKLYLQQEPPPTPTPEKQAQSPTWTIAGIIISSDSFPIDAEARSEAIRFMNGLKTDYNSWLTTGKTGYRKLLRQGLSERGILIGLDEKRRRGDSQPVGPVQEHVDPRVDPPEDRPTDPTPEPQAAEPEPTIEEVRALITEETAATHPEDVPGDAVCRATIANLRGAPTERLRSAIRAKFRPRDKIGRIAYLAKDVGDRWETEKQERQKLEAAQRNQEREALEWMAENDESEENRKFARAKLAWFT